MNKSMKNPSILFAIALLSFPTFALDLLKIESVKNGVLSLDKSVTVGNVLDTWSSCSSTDWSVETTRRGASNVVFKCKIDFARQAKVLSEVGDSWSLDLVLDAPDFSDPNKTFFNTPINNLFNVKEYV